MAGNGVILTLSLDVRLAILPRRFWRSDELNSQGESLVAMVVPLNIMLKNTGFRVSLWG